MREKKRFSEEKFLRDLRRKLETKKFVTENGCWLWLGVKSKFGHGQVRYRGKMINVHQASAILYMDYKIEEADTNYQVNHKIICPNRHCFNPEHLYIGSQSQNVKDAYNSELGTGRRTRRHLEKSEEEMRIDAGSEVPNKGERELD